MAQRLPNVHFLVPDLLLVMVRGGVGVAGIMKAEAELGTVEASLVTALADYALDQHSHLLTKDELEKGVHGGGGTKADVTKIRQQLLGLSVRPELLPKFKSTDSQPDDLDSNALDLSDLAKVEAYYKKCSMAGLTQAVVDAHHAAGVYFPINVIWARPHMTWEMGSCIAMLRGSQTGGTYIGNADFQVGQSQRKMLEGALTLNVGAIVTTPVNVLVLHNTVCKGYVGGGGVKLFDPRDPNHLSRYNEGENVADIFCLAVPHSWTPKRKHFDVTGEYPRDLVETTSQTRNGHVELHYPTARAYAEYWGWTTRGDRTQLDIDFGDSGVVLNTRVWQATQFHMNEAGEETLAMVSGIGHWGVPVYGGVVGDRTANVGGRCVRRAFDHTMTLGLTSK
jgi:hypothetical protein